MQSELNAFGQAIGLPVPDWTPPPRPARESMQGRFCRLEPLSLERHAAELYAAHSLDSEGASWTYLPYGPFADYASYCSWLSRCAEGDDPLFFAIMEQSSGKAVGLAAYLRIDPHNGSIEVGHLVYSPLLQRTPAATEAMYCLMAHAFALCYRRYEWKCNALNAPSRRAALRLGFAFEGVFRQAAVVKGRNRDTAWFSIIDREWPALQRAFLLWLAPENFMADGRQKISLSSLTAELSTNAGGA